MPGLLPARFPSPPSARDVRLSSHPALHERRCYAGTEISAALVHGVGMLCARHRYRVIGTVVVSNIVIPFSCGRFWLVSVTDSQLFCQAALARSS